MYTHCTPFVEDKSNNFDSFLVPSKPHHDFLCMHTLQSTSYFSGSYIFIEASQKNTGDKARLLSDEIEPSETVCIQFWYHMYGSDIGNLSIYLKTNQSETLVWSLSGDQGNRWRFGQTALNSLSLYTVSSYSYFPLVFEKKLHRNLTLLIFDKVCFTD